MNSSIFGAGHALLVGAGADLPNTILDAQGLAELLRDPARCAYPSEQVTLLTGPQATRDAILAALRTLSKTVNKQATILIYFSGHGYQVSTAGKTAYYLMPYGYDILRLEQTAVSGAELTAGLRALPAQKLLLLLDCCHAGGLEPKAPGLTLTKAPLPSEALALLSEGRGRVVIASSQANELSYAGQPYSAFTRAVIEALCGTGSARQDGYVRVADLALHARQVVPQRTKDRQHPILHFEQADNFALAYYAAGATQPKELPFAALPEIQAEPGWPEQCRLLADNINETMGLLRDYEEQRRLTNDPKTRRSADKEIERLKADLARYQAEYRDLGCAIH